MKGFCIWPGCGCKHDPMFCPLSRGQRHADRILLLLRVFYLDRFFHS